MLVVTENFDGQGKSLEEETLGSMRVAAAVVLLSGLVVLGIFGLLVWWAA